MKVPVQDAPAQDVLQRLVASALAGFAEKGFEGFSLDPIRTQAGRTRGVPEGPFADREALYRECFLYLFRRYPGLGRSPSPGYLPFGEDPARAVLALRSALRRVMRELFRDAGDPLGEACVRLLGRELMDPHASVQALILERMAGFFQVLRTSIGCLRPGLAAAEMAFLEWWVLDQCLLHRLGTECGGPLPHAAYADRISGRVVRGLGPGGWI